MSVSSDRSVTPLDNGSRLLRCEDNEPVPEKSTLDWLNLNALAPKAIQGAIDRIRHNTLASSGDAEVPKRVESGLACLLGKPACVSCSAQHRSRKRWTGSC